MAEPMPIIQAPANKDIEVISIGERDQPGAGGKHRRRQRKRHRPAIGDDADGGLQQRGRNLKGEGQKADLHEIERVVGLQQRIERG